MNGGSGLVLAVILCSAIAQAQTLYVSGSGSGNSGFIYKYTTNGVRTLFASGLNPSPGGMAMDGAGNLYLAGAGTQYVYIFTPNGTQSTFASGFASPIDVAFDAANDLFVSSIGYPHFISEITPGGTQTTIPTTPLRGPTGLAFDSMGNMFVADGPSGNGANNGTIYKFTPNGVQTTFASGLNAPYGIAFDKANNVYVADYGNDAIYKYTTNGIQSTFATGLNNPIGLAFDNAGFLYVADYGSGNVYKYTTNGVQSTFATGLYPTFIYFQSAASPTAPPQLAIAPAGQQVALYWPAAAGNFTLQTSTNLSATNSNWMTVTNGIPITGFTVTNTLPGQFFRLIQ